MSTCDCRDRLNLEKSTKRNRRLSRIPEVGNFVGKLDPATGKITLKKSPTNDSRPYGLRMIVVSKDGKDLFIASGGVHRVVIGKIGK